MRFIATGVSLAFFAAPAMAADEETFAVQVARIMGVASTYHCTCLEWPATWAALRRFDEQWHERLPGGGSDASKRVAWGRFERSSLFAAPEGHLAVQVRSSGPAQSVDIGVYVPDCSEFHREKFVDTCPAPAPVE